MPPRLSILLPVYNGAAYLQACIESVMQQDCPNFELVIGDDGSTDESAAIIRRFDDPRIRYHYRDQNLGLFGNLNRLLAEARAPVVRLLGQDDLLEPDCVGATLRFFDAHPAIGLTICRSQYIDAWGQQIGEYPYRQDAFPESIDRELAMQLFLYYGNLAGNITHVAVRRDALHAVGGFSEQYGNAGDFEMWTRVAGHYAISVMPAYLARIRIHSRQLSRTGASPFDVLDARRRIRRRLIAQMPPHLHSYAVSYTHMRHNALEMHLAVRWLIGGRPGDFLESLRIMGARDSLIAAFFWLVTVNNHLYRPHAVIEVTDPSVRLNLPRLRIIYREADASCAN
jgi:glycosyltransferase involved in cell wall biosynthesis